jgi:hypothetical protein
MSRASEPIKGRLILALQNRVNPFGEIHAVPERGLFAGNRGVIHDPESRTLLDRRWTTRAWIICRCEFRGRRRDVMGRNAPSGGAGWTELFFLDEVTALAAGHRPCFFCRREAAKDFIGRFADAFRIAAPKATELDARLHEERLASGGELLEIDWRDVEKLPDGAMVFQGETAYAVRRKHLLRWSFGGYSEPRKPIALASDDIWLLTPPTTLMVLRAGYRPVWHPSAGT